VLRIAVADKLHNARQVLADYRKERDALWSRFNAGKEDQLWFYRTLVRVVTEHHEKTLENAPQRFRSRRRPTGRLTCCAPCQTAITHTALPRIR
jgi:hypothetical protein